MPLYFPAFCGNNTQQGLFWVSWIRQYFFFLSIIQAIKCKHCNPICLPCFNFTWCLLCHASFYPSGVNGCMCMCYQPLYVIGFMHPMGEGHGPWSHEIHVPPKIYTFLITYPDKKCPIDFEASVTYQGYNVFFQIRSPALRMDENFGIIKESNLHF